MVKQNTSSVNKPSTRPTTTKKIGNKSKKNEASSCPPTGHRVRPPSLPRSGPAALGPQPGSPFLSTRIGCEQGKLALNCRSICISHWLKVSAYSVRLAPGQAGVHSPGGRAPAWADVWRSCPPFPRNGFPWCPGPHSLACDKQQGGLSFWLAVAGMLWCRGRGAPGCQAGQQMGLQPVMRPTAARQLLALSIGHSQEAHVQTKCWCGHALGSWGSHSLGPLSLLVMGTRDRAGRQAGRQAGQLSGC